MDINTRVNAPVDRVDADIHAFQDMRDLRAAFGRMPQTPRLLSSPDDAAAIDFPGQRTRVLLSGEESGGQFVIFLVELSPGFGAPDHHQAEEDEWWFVLEGEIDVVIGDEARRVGAGASAYAPRGCRHSFVNNSDRVARMISMNAPAGHERFFEAVSRLPGIVDDGMRDKLMRDHGVEFHGKVVLD